MTARTAGGRRAAICRTLNPPQDLPIRPTAPVHHGCAAIQAITAMPSASSCSVYSSASRPSDSPVPRAREVALAVWDVLENRGHRRPVGVLGEPEAGREPAAVGHGDPAVLDLPHPTRERRDEVHGEPTPAAQPGCAASRAPAARNILVSRSRARRPTARSRQFTIARRNPPGGMAWRSGGRSAWNVIWMLDTPATWRSSSTVAGSIVQRTP